MSRLLWTLSLGVFAGALDLSVLAPALPALGRAFNVQSGDLAWVFTLYLLVTVLSIAVASAMADRFGRRPVYLVCISLFAAGSIVAIFAPSYGIFLAARGIQALGAGGIFPVATATIGADAAHYDIEIRAVTAGAIGSATLFEGVKYAFTAGVSATTVQAGQPLTFSGIVTPNHFGQVVYLERQNASGGGFHVVDVGTVTLGSTYSITHYLFGFGKEVFRLKVPGNLENQGVSSSPPFAIEVTPAPVGALRPVPPSKLPQEGKV